MVSRRAALAAGGGALAASLAGCLNFLGNRGSLLEVRVDLRNGAVASRTFHIALETESGVTGWESREVPGETSESAVLDPPEDAVPVALHGTVGEFAGSVDILGVRDVDENFCLDLEFWHRSDVRDGTELLQSSDIRC